MTGWMAWMVEKPTPVYQPSSKARNYLPVRAIGKREMPGPPILTHCDTGKTPFSTPMDEL